MFFYGAQLLVAANIAAITSISLIPCLIYPFVLLVSVIISILREKGSAKEKVQAKE